MPDDPILWIDSEDPAMAGAIQAAQESFPEFARQAELEHFRIIPAFAAVAIKAFFPDPARPGSGEHMFVTDISTNGQSITGTLASQPGFASDLQEGQEVTFPVSRLSDWFLVNGDQGIGGFTIDVLRDQFSEEQRQEFDEYPPYAWYRHRQGTTAIEELEAVPACPRCQVRELPSQSPRGEVCGVCANGAVRCDCPRCGAPLIRHSNAPRECHRCMGM